ncbi:MAG TPA: histidine kinase [Bacteroidia bacterium]|nr:histidine kinase [Bacteroidia bacterium]
MKRAHAFFLFLFFAQNGFAQEPYFRHFGVEQGLPSSEVHDILQDRNGFIWFGTDRGVSKYDSYWFRNFGPSDGLTDNTVFSLVEDASGKIWCRTLNSKLCYFSGDRVVSYDHNEALKRYTEGHYIPQSLDITPSGDVVYGYQRLGCLRIDSSGKSSPLYKPRNYPGVVYEVHVSDSYFIFGAIDNNTVRPAKPANPVLHIDMGGRITIIPLPPITSTHYITAVKKKNGTVLIGVGRIIIEVAPDCSYRIHEFEARVIAVRGDNAGNSWISLERHGIREYVNGADLSGMGFTTFLADETVTDLMQDAEGGYWMSTLGHGVFYMASSRVHCLLSAGVTGGVSVTAIASDMTGKILLGTAGGFLHLCKAGRIVSTIHCNQLPGLTDFVQDIYVSPVGNIAWICTNNSLICLSPDGSIARDHGNGFGRTISSDSADGCWIAGTNVIGHYNSGQVKPERSFVLKGWIEETFWDSATGKLLVGSTDGLGQFDGTKIEPFLLAGEQLTTRVSAIRRTANNLFVVGTIGAGIHVVKNNQRTIINNEQGLASSIVNDIAVDDHNDLWVGTNAGVSQIHWEADTFSVNNFSIYHGLPTNEIRKILCRKDTVWIATASGAAWFIPREIEHSSVTPPIYIQEILVNGEKINADSISSFSHDRNQVRFSFLGISYRNGGNTTYRYRLAGLEQAWTYTANRSVEFASLGPGHYLFEVMARNGDGTWSSTAATFGFTVNPPYWYTWWFWAILAALVISICWWAVRTRLKNIRKGALQKGLLAEYQHQALTAQMNPHFIFNSLSSMQAFILSDEKENALRYIDRFSFLMRKSLEHSMLKFVPLEKEIELLRAYLDIEAMRFGDKLAYTITCDPQLDSMSIEVPTMAIQPFAENAIRHGLMHREEPGGQIAISFTLKENTIWCRVEDNGVGRQRSAEINRTRRKHISLGSSITEERLRLLCGVTNQIYSITYTDKTGEHSRSAGTIVSFLLPSRKREQHVESPAH